jgi:hypothetical protein
MGNLYEFFAGGADGPANQLEEQRIGADPAMITMFTVDTTDVQMHFVEDPAVRSYVICPGIGCPVCHLGSAPVLMLLLPVYDVTTRSVRVLRIPARRQPGSLLALLMSHAPKGKPANRLLSITRNGMKYAVTAHQVAPAADRGEDVIRAFLANVEGGLRLESAFQSMTAEELADVSQVANKLSMLGTWQPPSASPEDPTES